MLLGRNGRDMKLPAGPGSTKPRSRPLPASRAACSRKLRGVRDEWRAGAAISAGLNRLRKTLPTDNHPGARRATPPESGGEWAKELPSSDEEGWRAERRGGYLRQPKTSSRNQHHPYPSLSKMRSVQ